MKKYISKIKNIILGVGILLVSTVSAYAGFGVSPTDISYENLKPGATFTKSFTLSRSGDLQELDVTIQPDLADIESWFTYSPGKTFKFPAGQTTTTFEVTVNVPQDTAYDTYDGVIRLLAVPSGQEVRGVTITQGVRLDAGLVVTEIDVRILRITSIDVLDSELNQPIQIEITGENQGNVDASPTVKVQIMDLQMNVLEEHEIANFGFIKPNETTTLTAEFDTNLPSGEYFIQVNVMLDGESIREERLVFNINNIPEAEGEDEEVHTSNFLLSVGEFIKEHQVYLFYLLIAIVIEILVFIVLQKTWAKKKLVTSKDGKKNKVIPLLLGGKKTTRAALSFAVGFIVFVSLVLFSISRLEVTPTEDLEIAQKDVQGVSDYTPEPNPVLNVFPPVEVNKYPVYIEPKTSSVVIYEAQEDENFKVIDEIEKWYKVELPDGSTGWLQKSIIKSELTQGE